MRRVLLAVVLAALLAPAPALGQSVGFAGDVTAARLDAPGTEASGPLLFLGSLYLPPEALLEVEAASADVVVHYISYRRPAAADVNLHEDMNAPRTRTAHHENLTAWSLDVRSESFLQVEGPDGPGGPPGAEAEAVAARFVPRTALRFEDDVTTGSDWAPQRAGPWPNVQAEAVARTVVVRGELVVTFHDLDLRVEHDGGVTVYETGRVADDGDHGDDPVEEGERRRVVATFHDAVLRLHPGGADVRLHFHDLTALGSGAATLPDAEGSLRVGDRAVSVLDELRFAGHWTASLRPDGDRVAARVAGSAHSMDVDGAPVDLTAVVAPAPPVAAKSAWSLLAALLVALLVVPAAATHAVRTRRLSPDVLVAAAGCALEAGRPRRAARWSRRALEKDHADADAAAIRTVSLYRRGCHAEAVAWLEAWLSRHGDPTGELTLLLGLGRLETEGGAAAARTVRPALERDPSLRRLLEGPDA